MLHICAIFACISLQSAILTIPISASAYREYSLHASAGIVFEALVPPELRSGLRESDYYAYSKEYYSKSGTG